MAVVGIHKSQVAMPGMWALLAGFCDTVVLLGWQDADTCIYRINGKELPEDDKMVTLHITCLEGIKPFVNRVEVSETLWPASKS